VQENAHDEAVAQLVLEVLEPAQMTRVTVREAFTSTPTTRRSAFSKTRSTSIPS